MTDLVNRVITFVDAGNSGAFKLNAWRDWILYKTSFLLKLAGNEFDGTNALLLLITIMLRSKL